MPNKDKPLVDRHAPKNGVGWLVNTQQGKVCSFTNDSPTAHAKWVVVETRLLPGGLLVSTNTHNSSKVFEAA